MNSGVSAQTSTVDSVFIFITSISVFFLLLITFLMVYFIIKYNKKRNTRPQNIEGNTALEIIWTVIPTIIVLFMFYFGWKGFEFLRKAPEDALQVKVTARMWSWMFEYENGAQSDVLRVPLHKPVKLLLHSQDVIHSFYVPAFRIKEDAVPGIDNYLWFEVDEPGSYDVLCAEYCGLRHAYMLSRVIALSQQEFDRWYVEAGAEAEKHHLLASQKTSEEGEVNPQVGERLIKMRGCIACHSTDGTPLVGPSFKGIFGKTRQVKRGGQLEQIRVTEEYLRNSILNPEQDVVEGYQPLMPSQQGLLNEEEIVAIIQYLKELK